jgi:hypothetical protein
LISQATPVASFVIVFKISLAARKEAFEKSKNANARSFKAACGYIIARQNVVAGFLLMMPQICKLHILSSS